MFAAVCGFCVGQVAGIGEDDASVDQLDTFAEFRMTPTFVSNSRVRAKYDAVPGTVAAALFDALLPYFCTAFLLANKKVAFETDVSLVSNQLVDTKYFAEKK